MTRFSFSVAVILIGAGGCALWAFLRSDQFCAMLGSTAIGRRDFGVEVITLFAFVLLTSLGIGVALQKKTLSAIFGGIAATMAAVYWVFEWLNHS